MRTPPRPRRTLAAVVAAAAIAAGCAGAGDPAVQTPDEVTAALADLAGQSMRMTATAAIEIDEGELRALLREDDRLLALVAETLDLDGAVAIDELLARLAELRTELARWRVLAARGDDDSWRVAVETDDTVWLDLRARSTLDREAASTGDVDALLEPFELDVQLQLDLAALDGLAVADGDALGDLDVDEARDAIDGLRGFPLLGPETGPLFDLADGVLAGGLVQLGGVVDPRAWLDSLAPLAGLDESAVDELLDELRAGIDDGLGADALDLDGLVDEAVVFDGFRTDGDTTVVDVSVDVRAGLALLRDRYADVVDASVEELTDGDGRAATGVDELEQALDELRIDRLDDVAELRFGPDGDLRQLRVDVSAVGLQMAAAERPDDEDLAVVAEAWSSLERSGAFLVVDLTDVGQVGSVLGTPDTTVSWEQLRALVDAQAGLLAALGFSLDGAQGLGDGLGAGGDDGPTDAAGGLGVGDVTVGDCFDDGALLAAPGQGGTVPCDGPHDNEVFAVVELAPPGTPWEPGLLVTADERCEEQFADYVGAPYLESVFFLSSIDPTEVDWEAGRTAAACYLYAFEPETGSARGSGR